MTKSACVVLAFSSCLAAFAALALALDRHHARRQHPPPRRLGVRPQRPVRVRDVDAHGAQHGLDRLRGDLHRPAPPVGVLGHHAVGLRELEERTGGSCHAADYFTRGQ